MAVGCLLANRVRTREQLWRRARRYPGMGIVGGLLMGLAMACGMFCVVDVRAVMFAIIAVVALVGFHVTGINRRLDAMMELMENDAGQGTPEIR